MTTIQINNLNPVGADLLSDDESYLKELSDSELNVQGGLASLIVSITLISVITFWEP